MKMSLDLTKGSAYTDKTPYETWQETEGVPIYQGLAIDDLRTVTLAQWNRKGLIHPKPPGHVHVVMHGVILEAGLNAAARE